MESRLEGDGDALQIPSQKQKSRIDLGAKLFAGAFAIKNLVKNGIHEISPPIARLHNHVYNVTDLWQSYAGNTN